MSIAAPPASDRHPASPAPRVLVVDDSAPMLAAVAEVLEEGGCHVIGRAIDGSMALRYALEREPDVITLDLEMPRMDGFTFLRILQKTKNIPVIVITANSRPDAALVALELGARDFLAKPPRPQDIRQLRNQLVARVHALAAHRGLPPPPRIAPPDVRPPDGVGLVVVGASTGGPRALRDLLSSVQGPFKAPILIAQHMPPRFTEAFAGRLGRATGLDVAEARDAEVLAPGVVRVAPGGANLLVEHKDGRLLVRCVEPQDRDRWVPSVDILFESAARVMGARVLAIVLTGMGRDGAEGARVLRTVGAPMWTESSITAVIDGMPAAAAQGHGAADRLPLDELAQMLKRALELSR